MWTRFTRLAPRSARVGASWRLARSCNSTLSVAAPLQQLVTSQEITQKLLRILQSEEHISEFVRTYGTSGVSRVSVIKIGGEVIEKELDTLIRSLVFLKEVGLFPVVVHGAGPQMNEQLEKAGVEPQYVGGMRVTDKKTLTIARKVFLGANCRLTDAMAAAGVGVRPITHGVFEATLKDFDKLGFVGEISKVHKEMVERAIDLGQIPVLSCLGETPDGQTLNINADVAARELAMKIQPFKTIFINSKGGWIEDDGTKLKTIDMSQDFERMASRDYTGRQGTLLKLREINTLLQALPSTSSVALTSAAGLEKEILSSCSEGTVCVRGTKASASKSKVSNHTVTHATSKKYKVGILGARGFVGREVIRHIGRHPQLELVCASTRGLKGHKVVDSAQAPPVNPHTGRPALPVGRSSTLNIDADLEFCEVGLESLSSSPFADSVDVWILALPNGFCQQYADVLNNLKRKDKLVVDLSSDQRFNDDWVYGLPEAPNGRQRLKNATHIANPGCYATGAQVGLFPLLAEHLEESIPPHVFGVSGYSGAGTQPSNTNNLQFLQDNIVAYKSVNHIHEHEISHHLKTPVRFMPHVAPYFQGIHLTISAQLKDVSLKDKDIYELFHEFYAHEPLVKVTPTIPFVKDNAGHCHTAVGGFQVDNATGRVALIATIDNLLKGASTQAIQNINVALGMDEFAGILDQA